jgi:5,10-methylenetetrahydromethanopterin reductase
MADLDGLQFCLDLSHHPWTRPQATRSAEAMRAAAGRTVRTIEAADAAGLHSVWVSEDPDGWDAFGVLGAAARTTTQIQLGTGVTNPFLRHPNLLAMSISTLDRFTGGRAFLGLGRGQPEWYRESLGMRPGTPLKMLEATIRLLRQWWAPPYRAASRSGIDVRDWPRAIGPARERPPIYLAALGPKAVDLATRLADGLLIADFASLPFLERFVPDVLRRVEGYGRDPDRFSIFLRTGIHVTGDSASALRYRKTLMSILTPLPGMARHIEHPDYDIESIIGEVRAAMGTEAVLERGGNFIDLRLAANFNAARAAIPDGLINDLSYVGDAANVRAKLKRIRALGVTHVFLSAPQDPAPEAFTRQIEALR